MPIASPSITTTSWTGDAGDGLWETSGNWDNGVPQAGYDVILPAVGSGGFFVPYTVSLSSSASLGSLLIGDVSTSPITLELDPGAGLTTTGQITLGVDAVIQGVGQLSAGGGFAVNFTQSSASGNTEILAGTPSSGGTLDVTGSIDPLINLGFANSTDATTLKLESSATLSYFEIDTATQTLELGRGTAVTFANGVIAPTGRYSSTARH